MKKRALDKVYEEIDTKFKDMPDDKMQESIDAEVEKLQEEMENIQKQIDGMEASEKGLDDETRERLEKEIDKESKKINNLEGYRKNKTQITKIIEYREKLETKLSETITARDDSKKAYGEAKKELDEVNKILKDEKKTMEMGQDEYNDLQIRKEKAEKELKTQKEIFEKSKTKIEDLKTKIGKCNLAWRTLFANKTWDDIQLRASESKGRYTRKVEDEERLEEFRETFGKVEPEPVKDDKGSADPKKKAGKPAKTKTATEQQKDAFLESLRQHVDVEYRKKVREAKEQEYIDKHKAEQNER